MLWDSWRKNLLLVGHWMPYNNVGRGINRYEVSIPYPILSKEEVQAKDFTQVHLSIEVPDPSASEVLKHLTI